MKVLVVGSGGREHALTWAIASSPQVTELYCAPGNGGMGEIATLVDIQDSDIDRLVQFAEDKAMDLVVVGPENPLSLGLVDQLTEKGIKAFGPTQAAAQLESSKGYMKDLCADYDIPTARYKRCYDAKEAKDFLSELSAPYVIKADGLAAGKGVVIATDLAEAEGAVDEMFGGKFGDAGDQVVIEEFLQGEEASFFALLDGEHMLTLATAQDYKRVGDGDTGPNTGGMGAYSPALIMTPELCKQVEEEIIAPTVRGMAEKGAPYKGVLFAGLMITPEGPKLIEFNVRFGDPECQVLMARLESDLVPALLATVDGRLDEIDLAWSDKAALTVVMASKGYPGSYPKGTQIKSLPVDRDGELTVFHAGTTRDGGKLLATGGRVLNVTALGATIGEAQARAYAAVDEVDWPEGFCRRDIGWRAIK
ncbi:MAG: phosphoribosylamine--glycine ligase [Alphaproteobacteria bacterium]|nr:MAG: phosphoribosylamine--glycine ligase [Alphaproteobacteria bacterium]